MKQVSPLPNVPRVRAAIPCRNKVGYTDRCLGSLVMASASLFQRTPRSDIRLRIVLEGGHHTRSPEQLRCFGMEDQITFASAGPHSRVPPERAGLDVHVALSPSERVGAFEMEASACGLWLVVSSAGGWPEVVKEGVTGSLMPGNNACEAVGRPDELIGSAELRGWTRCAGRAFSEARYACEAFMDLKLEVPGQAMNERVKA